MAERPTLNQLLVALHEELTKDLGIARRTIAHAGTLGTVSENKWIEMLYKHLPKRYKVNRAFVIDSRGGCSDQIDIVIHDRQYSPFVLNYGDALYVPAESVYAVLEVKQNLNAEQIAYAADKTASVRALHRTSLPINTASGTVPPKPLHPIIGGLVAVQSDWSPPFGNAFRKAIAESRADGRLDMGCAAQHGGFEVKYSPNEPPTIIAERSEAALATFLLRFIARLQLIATVPCIDVLAYAANLRTETVE